MNRDKKAGSTRKISEESPALPGTPGASRRRLALIAVAIIAVVIAAAAIVVNTSGGSGEKPATSNSTAPSQTVLPEQSAAAVFALLAGIPQQGNGLGSPRAPWTLQYFGDLECTTCKEFTVGVLPVLLRNWVRTGKLRIEYRALQSATPDRRTFVDQQAAALAAGKQALMWNFIELFYREEGEENTGYATESYIEGIARQVPGLNFRQWLTDVRKPATFNELVSDNKAAKRARLPGTPTFVIGKTGGALHVLRVSSVIEPVPFNEAIEQAVLGS